MAFDPTEARDDHGRWVAGAGGGVVATAKPDLRVMTNNGDQWNKDTAFRLEQEYSAVRPELDEIARGAEGQEGAYVSSIDPEEWDQLSGNDQELAQEKFQDQNFESFYQSDVDNWSSEDAPEQAKEQVASDDEWKADALNEFLKDRMEDPDAPRIPFDADQLLDAITVRYEAHNMYKNHNEPEFDFDNEKLTKPDTLDEKQLHMPGIEEKDPSALLTPEMRSDIIDALKPAFEKATEHALDHMDAPDDLAEQAKESVGEYWDQMSDENKFKFAKDTLDSLDSNDVDGEEGSGKIVLPTHWDPLGTDEDNVDYRRTQAVSRYMADTRALQVMQARGITQRGDLSAQESDAKYRAWKSANPDKPTSEYVEPKAGVGAVTIDDMREADKTLWGGWKASSTSFEGGLLQLATAEELGGRLNPTQTAVSVGVSNAAPDAEKIAAADKIKERANSDFRDIGGYKGVMAAVRAKWETTQYLLDKADTPTVQLYRGLSIPSIIGPKGLLARTEKVKSPTGASYDRMPDLSIQKNGAVSMTTDANVANGWRADSRSHVTVRAEVPRTAILSVPSYGINEHSEHEVVVAGTAWHAWDAWHGNAPRHNDIPIGGKSFDGEHKDFRWNASEDKWEKVA